MIIKSKDNLVFMILPHQIENQRLYLHRIWREGSRGSAQDYGLPLNYIPRHLVSLGGSRQENAQGVLLHWVLEFQTAFILTPLCVAALRSPALTSVFLLEVHPSLCLASAVYQGVVQAHAQLCQLHWATGVTHKLLLRQKLLQEALRCWSELAPPRISYSPQIQKDVGSFLHPCCLRLRSCDTVTRRSGFGFLFVLFVPSASCSPTCSLRTHVWWSRWGCCRRGLQRRRTGLVDGRSRGFP